MVQHADIDHTGLTGVGSAFAGVRAVANAVTALVTSTWTAIAFAGTDRFDSDAFHDPATNNTRLTVPAGKAGKYLIGGNVEIAGNTTGERGCRIWLNGTTRIADDIRPAIQGGGLPSARFFPFSLYDLAVGDYVELQAWQNSGVSVNTSNTANSACEFWMVKVG